MSTQESDAIDRGEPSSKRPKLEGATNGVQGVGASEVHLDATVGEPQLETVEDVLEVFVTLHATWNGKSHVVELAESDRVLDLKDKLNSLTSVPPDRQKILGLVKGKLPPDEVTIKELKLVSGKKFSLVGTPVGEELQSRSEDMPDVMNDLDIDVSQYPDLMLSFANDQRNIRKVREATEALDLHIMNEPREGKPLLVLDLDYTLIDTKPLTRGALPPSECARPGLHEFLERCYVDYDICIWSQTSWVWLETKLVELGMVGSDRAYKISFVLDHKPMFKVFTKRNGKPFTHSVKPLKIIWNKFPQWNAHNTIHIDDLSRNFALNPVNGIKIDPFHNAHTLEAQGDRELSVLQRYLRFVAEKKADFRKANHRQWKQVSKHLHRGGTVEYNEDTGLFIPSPIPPGLGAATTKKSSPAPPS